MKNNFKSAAHGLNYQNLVIRKANHKQPVKVYSAEERQKFAETYGFAVSSKPPSKPKSKSYVEEKAEIDWTQVPVELIKVLAR